ncbi:MAG: HAD-IA family hydrolase, partial [Bacteroidaceae bacterium]|nr:HAD-IA family hydrolase [Bacteroidaceae bacterium]
EFIARLSSLCNRTITYDQAKDAWLGFIVKVQTELLEDIQTLRPQYRLSVLSNTNPFLQGWARSKEFTQEGKSLDDYFDNLFLSYKMHCSKPSEDIYRKMLVQGNMVAHETLFVDDSEKNIDAARRVGINTLLVKNGEDWRVALREYLKKGQI